MGVRRHSRLPPDLAEWLRSHALHAHRKRVDIVRQALTDYRSRVEGSAQGDSASRSRSLLDRFATGKGVDMDILRDGDQTMWNLD